MLGIAVAGLCFGAGDGIGDGGEAVVAQGLDVGVLDDGESAFVDVEHGRASVAFERLEGVAIAGPAGGVQIRLFDIEEFSILREAEGERGAALHLLTGGGVHAGELQAVDGSLGGGDGFGEVGRVGCCCRCGDTGLLERRDALPCPTHDHGGDGHLGQGAEEIPDGLLDGVAFAEGGGDLGDAFVE